MLKSLEKTKIGQKTKTNFIPEKKVASSAELGLSKYKETIDKPKKNEVHLLSYYHNKENIAYQINAESTKRLSQDEFQRKLKIKEVKGLIIKKVSLNMKESNALYICKVDENKEEKEEEITDVSRT